MTSTHYQPALHRSAIATACLALLPIVIGALVTTLGAGMAFLDWPTSDGQNMLLYNLFKDLREGHTHKFVEHGHRLGGMLIGLASIGLAAVAWRQERRFWARTLGLSILAAVVLQGLLGGARVLADERQLAMLHGALAAIVFSLMGVFAQVTSAGWHAAADAPVPERKLQSLRRWALLLPAVILLQYVLGGLLRHLGMALLEHIGMAIVVLLMCLGTAIASRRTGIPWIERAATLVAAVAFFQFGLGISTFITKFGFPWSGYVAVVHSPLQTVLRTSHTVVGMLLLVSAVVLALRVVRTVWLQQGGLNSRQRAVGLAVPMPAEGSAG